MTHLLDTNVCIAAMRGNQQVQQRLFAHAPTDCGISTVTLYELYVGVERCHFPLRERQRVEAFVKLIHVLPFDTDAARETAHLRWSLQQRGELIGPHELMLAGQALSLGTTFVTHNTNEFGRVPNLMLEDWQV